MAVKGKRKREAQEKKRAAKAARFRRGGSGKSRYAMKKREQANGNFRPGSPFRSVVEG